MSDELRTLEATLVSDPFDADARMRYAARLSEAGRYAEAVGQWRLLLRQAGDGAVADTYLRAASDALAAGEPETARQWLAAARHCSDFDPGDPRIALLDPEAAGPARLHSIQGGRAAIPHEAEVISMRVADVVRFSDIVGMDELKKLIRLRIVEPFVNPGLFQRFKKRAGGGVLLYGPPGCGKTLMARAIATECAAKFTHVGISDILNLWVGESERNLAAIFEKARSEAPSVLFFDELDALAFSRSRANSDHTRTLVNEFLSQLDGMGGRNDKVMVLAATNMPWNVDDAMKRPGRFDRQLFVPPPDASARAAMFEAKLRDVPCESIDCATLASRCEHYSGADIEGLIERAKDELIGGILDGDNPERPLSQIHLERAMGDMEPSTLEWLATARTLVKFGGGGKAYKDVEAYLRAGRLY